jgi:hypothetical protein
VLGSLSGTSPGTPLAGGVTLPLNWDAFLEFIWNFPNPPMFIAFVGQLDDEGKATAAFDTLGTFAGHLNETIHFAFTLVPSYDYASNAVSMLLSNVTQIPPASDEDMISIQ